MPVGARHTVEAQAIAPIAHHLRGAFICPTTAAQRDGCCAGAWIAVMCGAPSPPTTATVVASLGQSPRQLVATTRGFGVMERKRCLISRRSSPVFGLFGGFLRFLHALHTSTTARQADSEKVCSWPDIGRRICLDEDRLTIDAASAASAAVAPIGAARPADLRAKRARRPRCRCPRCPCSLPTREH